jgi:cyclophilin family peptidyl-prolyl cis-trans isomerase
MEKKATAFKTEAANTLKIYKLTTGNKYCYFDIRIDNRYLRRVVFELFADCPRTSENFLSLCKGFKNEFGETVSYVDSTIHRVVKNGFLQGGDLKNPSNYILIKGGSKSIYKGEFADENYNHLHDAPGILGMVKKNKRKHSNECQIYITFNPISAFNKEMVAFGRIVMGYQTIIDIEIEPTNLQRPLSAIKIIACGEF